MFPRKPRNRKDDGPLEPSLQERLFSQLSELDSRARKGTVVKLANRVQATFAGTPSSTGALVMELVSAADGAQGEIVRLDLRRAQLMVEHRNAETPRAAKSVLQKAIQRHATSRKDYNRDVKALERYLDHEAVQERMAIAISEQVDIVEVCYRCATGLVKPLAGTPELLDAFGSGRAVSIAFSHAKDGRRDSIRQPALKFLTALIGGLPARERLRNFGSTRLGHTQQWALGTDARKFVQVAALELLCYVAPTRAANPLKSVLENHEGYDGPIIRRNAIRLCAELPLGEEDFASLTRIPETDPSEHARQELAQTLAASAFPDSLERLSNMCSNDTSPRVRGVALRALTTRALADRNALTACETAVSDALAAGEDRLDREVALEAVARLCLGYGAASHKNRFVTQLIQLAERFDDSPQEANRACILIRHLEVESAPLVHQTRDRFRAALDSVREGRTVQVKLSEDLPLRELELALAAAADGDLTVSLRKHRNRTVELRRGEPRRFRLWRLLHELSELAPDKRKAYAHTHGRAPTTGSVVPSTLLCEVTRTRVPGERRLHPRLGGWGHFVPRVDDFLSASRLLSGPLRIVTALGVLTVTAPESLWQRFLCYIKLTLRYAKLDDLRERSLAATDEGQRKRFVLAMEEMGFKTHLGHGSGQVEDRNFSIPIPKPIQYLAASGLLPDLRQYWEGPLIYIMSPTGNTAFHLSVVVWLVLAGFLIRAATVMASIERARAAIPISVGGWGTRGKSGTERLKAALFHALRYDVVVKTTGCEAMFIHARRDLPAREIFLYRPYDKATIWEQRKVLEYGYQLKAQVFLWECMALNPSFVEVLNRDWMRDEVTTLTNAYPDHEDIMGPSGEDVARVIGLFTPDGGVAYTSEEQMLPILREVAQARGSTLVPVSPLDADLLPADMLARFPYDEHPRNIKLVMRLAEHYGVDQELALVEMGDGVVPDLGVLKTYPEASYRTRTLQFSNGMSANERAGFLSNWSRLGFDKIDRDAQPGLVTVAVINNRADRVARSRVFSGILAQDVNVTHMVLIGTNLSGMQRFISEATNAYFLKLSLDVDDGADSATRSFDEWLRHAGMPIDPNTFKAQIAHMLATVVDAQACTDIMGAPALATAIDDRSTELHSIIMEHIERHCDQSAPVLADIQLHCERLRSRFKRAEDARGQIHTWVTQGNVEAAETLARETAITLSLERLHVLEQADAKGDQVIDFMTRHIEPGHRAKVLGCQNIKGTGLDFVYRWLSLQAVTDTLAQAEAQPDARAQHLAWLSTYTDYGLIDCQLALRQAVLWKDNGDEGWIEHMGLLESLATTLKQLEDKKIQKLASTGTKVGLWERFLNNNVEPLLDHWDSTRRTKLSEAVARDLFTLRVGQGRAALLLRDLVARQKGGWLHKELRSKFRFGEERRTNRQ